MSNFKGKFTVPKSKDMAWAKASNKKWDQRAKVIERMNSQQPFDSEWGEIITLKKKSWYMILCMVMPSTKWPSTFQKMVR